MHALRLAHVRWETLREYITLPHAATHTWQGSTLHAPGLPAEASSWCAPAQTLSSPLMRARPVLADYGVQLREGCFSAGACRSGAHGSRRVFRSRDSSRDLAVGSLLSCRTAHAIAALRATARCSDNDFGRDRHVRALSFPNMCDLLCGYLIAERSADDKQTCHGSS